MTDIVPLRIAQERVRVGNPFITLVHVHSILNFADQKYSRGQKVTL